MDISKNPNHEFDKIQYLQSILENITDIVTIIDVDGTVRYESSSLSPILGYEPEELIGKNAFSFVHPEDYKNVFQTFLQGLGNKGKVAKVEVRFKHKDGTWRNLECIGKNLLFDPQVRGVVVSSRDISERRKDENQIRLQAEALEAASNSIVITDIAGSITWVNSAFTKMTGYSFSEVMGKNPRILKSGEQAVKVYEELWKTILAGETWVGELINRRKDGTLYFEKQTITPVRNREGDITYFIAIKEDISAGKKLEAQFRQAQKMEAVGRLAGGVAHDFNNLLTIILWQSDMLMANFTDKNDPKYHSASEIKIAGQRAAALTRQLLAFSRKQIFQIKVLDLNEIVRGVDKMIRRLLGEDIELVTLFGQGLKNVQVDAAQIEQVIMNLAVNARDAMPSGGKIVLETEQVKIDSQGASRYPGLVAGEYLLLKVKDTGTGMTEEVKAHLFEPFFTTKENGKGTGLGLATCYGIMKQSKGFIYVDSQIGKGSTFLVFLPPAEEQPAQLEKTKEIQLPKGTETILIAEDEDLVRGLAVQVLSRQGFKILEARNGLDALKIAEEYKEAIHLIITDMVMPYMGGGELAEKFRVRFPKTKIMFTSGYTDNSAVKKWLDQGCRFVQKPYTYSELLLTVREILDSKSSNK
jgi:two-component system cell cycle sensor histidine kinase/response regulator CckA